MKTQQELALSGLNIRPCEDYMCDEQLNDTPQLIGVINKASLLVSSRMLINIADKKEHIGELKRMYGNKAVIRMQECDMFQHRLTFIYEEGSVVCNPEDEDKYSVIQEAASLLSAAFPSLEKSYVTIGIDTDSGVITFLNVIDYE